MITDIHAHYEPRILPLPGLLAVMDREGVRKTILIPHLTDPPETRKADLPVAVQRFMFYHRPLRGVAIALTKSMYRKKGEWNLWLNKISSASSKFKIVAEPDNDAMAGVIARYPDRFAGWIFVNPSARAPLETIEKYAGVRGMIGVKLHPFWHQFPFARAEPVISRAGELKMPVLIHLGFDDLNEFSWLPEKYGKVKFIFAHLGIPFYADLWRKYAAFKNVYFDLASTYHVDQRLVRAAVKVLGAERLLFGTDAPYGSADAVGRIKKWVENLPVSDAEKELIFNGNSRRILEV